MIVKTIKRVLGYALNVDDEYQNIGKYYEEISSKINPKF